MRLRTCDELFYFFICEVKKDAWKALLVVVILIYHGRQSNLSFKKRLHIH